MVSATVTRSRPLMVVTPEIMDDLERRRRVTVEIAGAKRGDVWTFTCSAGLRGLRMKNVKVLWVQTAAGRATVRVDEPEPELGAPGNVEEAAGWGE